jgi:hypothetical protein
MSLFKKATAPSRAVEQLRARKAPLVKELEELKADAIKLGDQIEAALTNPLPPNVTQKAEIEKDEITLAGIDQRIKRMTSAIATLDRQITEAEQEIAAAARRKAADEAACVVNGDHEKFRGKMLVVIEALEALFPHAEALGRNVWSANEIAGLARALITDLGGASEVGAVVAGLLEGTKSPSSVAAPAEAPPVAPSAPDIPTRMVLSLFPLQWSHGDELRSCAKFQQVQLPISTADRAVKVKRALEMSNPKAKGLYSGFVMAPLPGSPGVIDLDDVDLKPPQAAFGNDIARLASGMKETGAARRAGLRKRSAEMSSTKMIGPPG